jgi:hypothetical protein
MSGPIVVHDALKSVKLRPLFSLQLSITGVQKFGDGGIPQVVGPVSGGRFEGEKLSGQVLPGGNDWQTVLADGTLLLDAKLPLQTDDGAMIILSFRGVRSVAPEVQVRMNAGEAVDPSEYYFRIAAQFYTTAPRYEWLNRIVAVGAGQRLSTGPVYNILAVE